MLCAQCGLRPRSQRARLCNPCRWRRYHPECQPRVPHREDGLCATCHTRPTDATHNVCRHCRYLRQTGKTNTLERRRPRPDGKCATCRERMREAGRTECSHCIYVGRTGRLDALPYKPRRCIECEMRKPAKKRRVCSRCEYKLRMAAMTPQQRADHREYMRIGKKIGFRNARLLLQKRRVRGTRTVAAA